MDYKKEAPPPYEAVQQPGIEVPATFHPDSAHPVVSYSPDGPTPQGTYQGQVYVQSGRPPYPGQPQIIIVQQPAPQPTLPEHTDTDKCIEIILIIFFPFLAVWYHHRSCTGHVCLSICLTLMLFLPGFIHAVWYCYLRDGH